MKLYIISLIGCPYSSALIELLDSLNINYNIKEIQWEDKDMNTNEEISTFPQVYINNKLLGGYEDLNEIIMTIKKIYSSNTKKKLMAMSKFLNNKYEFLERRDILNIIKIFIS